MHSSRLVTLALTLSLAACAAPTGVADVPEGLVPVELAELPDLTLDTAELPPELLDDEGGVSAAALADATLYLDERVPPALVDDRPEPGQFEGAQPVSLQCYETSNYPGQQVTHRALVCVPRRGGGSLCYYTFATYTVTVTCDTFLFCSMAAPNEDRCSYSVGGATYTTTRPASEPDSSFSEACPGTGNPDACLPPGSDPFDPFDPWGPGGGHIP